MSRVPVRARLTGAFAVAMLIVLAGAAAFVHVRLADNLNDTIDNGLRSRADELAAGATRTAAAAPRPRDRARALEPEESFAQVIDQSARVLDATGGARGRVLTAQEVGRAARGTVTIERPVPGIEGTARMVARRAAGPGLVVVAGQSLQDRDDTLAGVVRSLSIGGPAAILLASLVGYLLSGLGFGPVEAMRRRAELISLSRAGERLPLPGARDEIRRLGETLNEMLARMEASFERERRFVADAGHELRTPLAVLKTELESAQRTPVDGERRESLAAAGEEVDHLVQLADDLLLLANAGEGRLRVEPERVDVHDLLERSRERFADRAHRRGRVIEVRAPDGIEARLDPLRMRQALGNLVDNALRHGAGTVALAALQRGTTVEIEVSDEGHGFADELAPRAFERFARGDTSRAHGGSGLGLAIVRAIAEAHGGAADVVGDRPGATVRLTLPFS